MSRDQLVHVSRLLHLVRTEKSFAISEFHDQADNVKNEYYKLLITKNIKYIQRAANSQAADRPAWGWSPAGHIIITL
jgi:hypothetical protein